MERTVANLIDAVSEGIRSPDLQTELADLQERRAALQASLFQETAPPPAMHPNLAQVYRGKVACLSEAWQGPDGTQALEMARELIDQIIISPPDDEEDPPRIEVVGELVAMLNLAGLGIRRPCAGYR